MVLSSGAARPHDGPTNSSKAIMQRFSDAISLRLNLLHEVNAQQHLNKETVAAFYALQVHMAQSSPPTPAMARPAASAPGMRVCEFLVERFRPRSSTCALTDASGNAAHACASTCVGDLCRAFLRELRSFLHFSSPCRFFVLHLRLFAIWGFFGGCWLRGVLLRKFGFLLFPLQVVLK